DFPDYSEFLDSCDAESSFLFSPDEKWMDVEEVFRETRDVLKNMRVYRKIPEKDLLQVLTEFSYDGKLACVPFYSVFEDKTVYLPYIIIKVNTGSNGMCAGNSPKEAIIQGLAEIYERYAQQKIMMENLAAPDIDIEMFKGTEVYKKLVEMAEKHIGIQILDFSCGMDLPVVALKIIEEDGGISIHPGADPSPITALERCLTETYQGATLKTRFKTECMNPPDDPNDVEQIKAFYENLKNAFINGTGAYPDSIQNDRKMPGFKGFAHPVTVSDADDFQYMLDIAKRCGKNVYIRDNSYLGIPAFYVFIPGMSDIGFFPGPEAKNYLNFGRELYTLRSLPIAPVEDVKHLKEFIEADMRHKYAVISAKDCFALGIKDYMPEEVLADADKLLEALTLQIEYLEGKGEPVFTEENWPVCYHCDRCAYREECRHKAFIKVFNSIRKTYKGNVRPQTSEMLK
ncbi:MAG: YcaO-like family protein, partial [Anaerolineaceae bacterium]|nr:YcaO-like family protein [Anaerolineaceae bacterium]